MEQSTQATGLAILREISPWRRFFRNWAFYLLIFATIVCIITSPEAWPWYFLIFLVGSNVLALSTIFEEGINKWTSKTSVI